MRHLVYILCFYLLGIAVIPCGDVYNACEPSAQTATTPDKDNHSHGNDSDDVCSPFCTCSCCNISVNAKPNFTKLREDRVYSNNTKKSPVYNSTCTAGFYGNIWQPPRLS